MDIWSNKHEKGYLSQTWTIREIGIICACSDHGQPRYHIWIKCNKRQMTSCVHKMCGRTYGQTNMKRTWPAKFGQILIRTDTRLVFCNRKLMRTDIFFTRTTKPICNFVNPDSIINNCTETLRYCKNETSFESTWVNIQLGGWCIQFFSSSADIWRYQDTIIVGYNRENRNLY
jgi:hypothetical protein